MPFTLYREDPACLDRLLSVINSLLEDWHLRRGVCAGILIGGGSRRMGRAKGLLRAGGRTLMERSFATLSAIAQPIVLIGAGDRPGSLIKGVCLPDALGVQGPLAGLLAAFRWAPESAWIISAVDLPLMSVEAWHWLLGRRKPGAWAVLPRLSDGGPAEVTAGLYEPMLFDYAESLAQRGILALQALADHPKVIQPLVPPELARQWRNVNTMDQWKRAQKELRGRRSQAGE
jgi:molybdopterin-guanine dinucleotide biosynthesis protein A